jgi:hypothetical protein
MANRWKAFEVKLSDLVNRKKNPKLILNPKAILKNKKIPKRFLY